MGVGGGERTGTEILGGWAGGGRGREELGWGWGVGRELGRQEYWTLQRDTVKQGEITVGDGRSWGGAENWVDKSTGPCNAILSS